MKTKFIFLMLLVAALTAGSCSKSDDSGEPDKPNPDPVNPVNPDPEEDDPNAFPFEEGFDNLTDAQLDGYTSDLAVRLMFMAMDPDAAYNDIDLIDHYLNGLAYTYSKDTRGIWGQAKAVVDFGLILKDANALHRSTLVGAMCKWGYSDKASRDQIWSDIQKSKCLPDKYNSLSSDEFWKEFSSGKLDWYAKEVYKAVMDEARDGQSRTGDLAADLAVNRLRHIDLTLAVAPKLIEAGANIVFAFGDDLISNGKLAYDFVETNGKVMLQLVDGNLTGEACLDAVNNNLKLLTKGLEEIVPTSQDLTELLSDLTFEQIKALNAEIEDVIKRAGNQSLSEGAVQLFVENVKGIIEAKPWTMNFADIVYEDEAGNCFEIETVDGKAYQFIYSDKNENVLLEAKCAVKETYITIRVDYIDDNCDLMPKGTTVGDVVPIPYLGANSDTAPERIYLWWNSSQHKFVTFNIKKEALYTAIRFKYYFSLLSENGTKSSTSVAFNFTPDEITMTRQKNTYIVKAEHEESGFFRTLTMELEQDGLNYYGKPNFGNIKSLTYHYNTLGDPEIPSSGTGNILDHLSFTITNHPFLNHVKGSEGDEYDLWRNNSWTELNVQDFFMTVLNYKNGSVTSNESFTYRSESGGEVTVDAFYTVEDINIYH